MSDLGLPNSTVKTDVERPFMEYTIPESMVGLGWSSSGFSDGDRTFKMTEISPRQQDHAAKIAGQNASALGRELMFASLWIVGDWKTAKERAKLDRWWEAIGSKGRRLVEAAFMRQQSVEEVDVETFLSSGKPGM